MDNHSQYFSIEETFGLLYFKLSFCCKFSLVFAVFYMSLVLLISKSLLIIIGMCKNKDEVPFKLTKYHTLYICIISTELAVFCYIYIYEPLIFRSSDHDGLKLTC